MTRLQTLNLFLTERFMAALNEVMEKVGGTVLEYEQEVERAQRENEFLKGRLQELEKLLESSGSGILFPSNTAGVVSSQQQRRSHPKTLTEPRDHQPNHQKQLLSGQHVSLRPEAFPQPSCPEYQLESVSAPSTADTQCLVSANNNEDVEFALLNEMSVIKTEPTDNAEQQVSNADTSHSPLLQISQLDSASGITFNTSDPSFLNCEIAGSIPQSDAPIESNNGHKGNPFASQKPFKMINSCHNVPPSPSHQQVMSSTNCSFSNQSADPRPTTQGGFVSATVAPMHKRSFRLGRGISKAQGSLPCPQCGRLFVYHSQLKVHMYIHTGEKPYVCKQCGKRFNNGGTLRNHSSVHRQVRMYSCPMCFRRFKDAYTCRKHLRVHAKGANPDLVVQPEISSGCSRMSTGSH